VKKPSVVSFQCVQNPDERDNAVTDHHRVS
jgi:hypothetical protein